MVIQCVVILFCESKIGIFGWNGFVESLSFRHILVRNSWPLKKRLITGVFSVRIDRKVNPHRLLGKFRVIIFQ